MKGNFSSDAFNSLIDETTGLLTTFTVYMEFEEDAWIFYSAIIIYGVNIFIRLLVGLYTVYCPAEGSQIARLDNGSITCGAHARLIAGMVLILLEPVSGVRLLSSAFEAAPALTKDEEQKLTEAKTKAINSSIESSAKIKEASEKAAEADLDLAAANDIDDAVSKSLAKRMAESRQGEVAVVKLEAQHLQVMATIVQEETELKFLDAAVVMRERAFNVLRRRLAGTEVVEVIMAVCEDIPEMALAGVFAAKGGLAGASNADISLFVTSQAISVFHAAKCFWSFWSLNSIIRKAKKGRMEKLDTCNGYFSAREIESYDKGSPASCDLAKRRDLAEPLKLKVAKKRQAWEKENKKIEEDVKSTGSLSLKQEIEKRKAAEAERKAKIEEQKRLATISADKLRIVQEKAAAEKRKAADPDRKDLVEGNYITKEAILPKIDNKGKDMGQQFADSHNNITYVRKISGVVKAGLSAGLLLAVVNDDYSKTLGGLKELGRIPTITKLKKTIEDVVITVYRLCGHAIYYHSYYCESEDDDYDQHTEETWKFSFHGAEFPRNFISHRTDPDFLTLAQRCGLNNAARAIKEFRK